MPKFLWPSFEERVADKLTIPNRTSTNSNLPSRAAAVIVMNSSSNPVEIKQFSPHKIYKADKIEAEKVESANATSLSSTHSYDQSPCIRENARNASKPRNTRDKQLRPSLSQQLAAIANNSDILIDNMKQTIIPTEGHGKEKAMLLVFCKRCSVGRCESLYASPVQFYSTRCHYAFHHPQEKRIEMEMQYKDMANIALSEGDKTFAFRVPRMLEYFTSDYNPADQTYNLQLTFGNLQDWIAFKSKVLPAIQALAHKPR